jgi:hypothetical protein
MKFVLLQQSQLDRAQAKWQYAVLQIAFDETEMKLKLDAQGTTASTMVCQAKLFARDVHGDALHFTITMPPLVLETTTAATLLAGLSQRLPVGFDELAARC